MARKPSPRYHMASAPPVPTRASRPRVREPHRYNFNDEAIRHFHPGGSPVNCPSEPLEQLERRFFEAALDAHVHSGGPLGDMALRIIQRRSK